MAAPADEARRRNARFRMYLMMSAMGLTQWVPKLSLASLVPLIAAARRWDRDDAPLPSLSTATVPTVTHRDPLRKARRRARAECR
jgi:hypothetical protein